MNPTAFKTGLRNQGCRLAVIESQIGEAHNRVRRLSEEIDASFSDLHGVINEGNELIERRIVQLDLKLESSKKDQKLLRKILRQSREYTDTNHHDVKQLEISKEGEASKQGFLLIAVYLVFKKFCVNVLLVWVNYEPQNFSSQEKSRFSHKKSLFSSIFPFWKSSMFNLK